MRRVIVDTAENSACVPVAWSDRNWAAMAKLVHDPPADFAAANAGALNAPGVPDPRFAAGRVARSGSSSAAAVTEQL